MATKTAGEQIAEYKAKIKELEDKQLEELQTRKAELEAQLEAVNNEINAILPPMKHPAGRPRTSKAAKAEGIKVSANALTDRIKASADGELSIRKEGLDLASVRKVVEESKGKFTIGGKTPWFFVSLAK